MTAGCLSGQAPLQTRGTSVTPEAGTNATFFRDFTFKAILIAVKAERPVMTFLRTGRQTVFPCLSGNPGFREHAEDLSRSSGQPDEYAAMRMLKIGFWTGVKQS
jgi:hypothetical protein